MAGNDESPIVLVTTGEDVTCEHELKKLGAHWTCMLCGERQELGAPVASPPGEASAAVPKRDAFDGLTFDSSDEKISEAREQAKRLLARHEARNRERLANSKGGVQEHVDNIQAAGAMAWDFLTGGDD